MPPASKATFVRRAALVGIFTFSGASALVYEVLWTRRLTHIFGSTTLAVSTVLAAFMGGLAAGSWLLGALGGPQPRQSPAGLRGCSRSRSAGLGLAVPFLLKAVEAVYLRPRPGARERADGVLRRPVPPRRPRARAALRPDGRDAARARALARRPRGRDRRERRRALRREHARGRARDRPAAYVLLPRLGVRRGGARRRRDQRPRGRWPPWRWRGPRGAAGTPPSGRGAVSETGPRSRRRARAWCSRRPRSRASPA